MKWLFVKYTANWADEIDVCTIWIVPEDKWENWRKQISASDLKDIEIYYGSNEFITIESVKNVPNDCDVKWIPEFEATVIINWFASSYELKSVLTDGLVIGQIDIFSRLAEKIEEISAEEV